MVSQLSLEKTFLLATWMESIFYGTCGVLLPGLRGWLSIPKGFLFCLFGGTMYLYFSSDYRKVGTKRERHTTVMIIISSVMFLIATFHVVLEAIRFVHGFSDKLLAPGGPGGYLGRLRRWDYVLQDALYATQVNLGSAAAIYRCWVLWNHDWKIIAFPTVLFLANTAVGYVACGTYTSIDSSASIFSAHITQWIKTLYAMSVVLNSITASLIAYRMWVIHKESPSYRLGSSKSLSVVRIVLDSGALQLPCEIILLALYAAKVDAQYILLGGMTPIVAITFNAITIRLKMRSVSMDVMPLPNTHHVQTVGGVGRLGARKFQVSVIQEGDEENMHSYKNNVLEAKEIS